MGQTKLVEPEYPQIAQYPDCRKCGMPMWFIRSAKGFEGQFHHFKCLPCQTTTEVLHREQSDPN
jgi:hypothetical protein